MNEAAAIDDGEPLSFELTGGEPFLDFDSLVKVVSHAGALGATLCSAFALVVAPSSGGAPALQRHAP